MHPQYDRKINEDEALARSVGKGSLRALPTMDAPAQCAISSSRLMHTCPDDRPPHSTPANARVGETDEPGPHPNEVLIKIQACITCPIGTPPCSAASISSSALAISNTPSPSATPATKLPDRSSSSAGAFPPRCLLMPRSGLRPSPRLSTIDHPNRFSHTNWYKEPEGVRPRKQTYGCGRATVETR